MAANPSSDLKRSRRRAARAIPAHLAVVVALGLGLRLGGQFVAIPIWLALMILLAAVLPLVLDIANVVSCAQQLRRQGQDEL